MQDSKQDFTVFSVDEEGEHCFRHVRANSPQGAADEYERIGSYTPVAWAEERHFGGTAATKQAALAALAAGRSIDRIDGKWVALGVEKPANRLLTTEENLRDIQRILNEAGTVAEANAKRLAHEASKAIKRPGMTFVATVPDGLSVTPADLAMVARDGPAKPAAVVIPKPAEPTAKPAISGLQREYSSTHLLGSYR